MRLYAYMVGYIIHLFKYLFTVRLIINSFATAHLSMLIKFDNSMPGATHGAGMDRLILVPLPTP